MNEKKKRIEDKIIEINEYIDYLLGIVPSNFDEYSEDLKTKAACEHYFEKIIESLVDLAYLAIKLKKLKIPRDDKELFDILVQDKIINSELANKLKDAKGMRNIIAHEYGKVDDEMVFDAINQELLNDAEEFIKRIKAIINIKSRKRI